jgi:PIN domain nuclease of toxin-antitoxin system
MPEGAPRPVLLDTCAALWLMNGDPMSAESLGTIRAARAGNVGVYVSPISAWEIATLVARNRVQLRQPPDVWFASLLALPGLRLADMAPAILIASASLPPPAPRDPADRIIAATARALGYILVTRDGELLPFARAGHLEAVGC